MITNSNHKDALLTLQTAGISKTSQRLAVLDILLKATTPLSVNTIRQTMKTKANIDKVTVYRILSLFKQHGIIREISPASGANYFEMATLDNPLHPHFSCRNCGAFTCLEPIPFTQPPESILSKDDYSIDHIEINISGLCACCRNATKPESQKQYYKDKE
ncbi:MAG: transcriptional repressor [Deltaproteobacteria bacterium]|nr:transcriptional repressor [Deltaproteobacteria bacterium]